MFSRLLPSLRPLLRRHFTRKLPHWRVKLKRARGRLLPRLPLRVRWASSGWYPAIDYHLIENRKGSLSASIAGKLRQFGRVHGLRAWNRPSEHPEFQSSWERDKPASLSCCRSREIAADRASQCSAQREGKPLADLERIVEDLLTLVTAGTIQSNAQSVIIVVRKIRSCHWGTNPESAVSSAIGSRIILKSAGRR